MSVHRLSILPGPVIAPRQTAAAPGLHVLLALPDGHDVFSLSILLDLLAAANRITGAAHFTCEMVAEDRITEALHRLEPLRPADLLLLVADAEERGAFPPPLIDALQRLWHSGGAVGAWGSGCLALAEAGMLAGRRFALAAEHRPRLAARGAGPCPTNLPFCADGRVLTSVGRSVLSDMALHLIDTGCGRATMIAVMDHCLIRRTHDDGCPVPDRALAAPGKMDPRIATVDRWIDRNIARRFGTRDLALTVGLSARQLERLFLRHLDRTPAGHLESKRMSLALKLMRETDLGVAEIARSTGYPCPAAFRRKFKRRFGTTPRRA